MKVFRFASAALLTLSFGAALAKLPAQTNEDTRKEAKAEAKQQHKTDKAQAKADKARAKALNTSQAKDAARKQDKADTEAAKPQN